MGLVIYNLRCPNLSDLSLLALAHFLMSLRIHASFIFESSFILLSHDHIDIKIDEGIMGESPQNYFPEKIKSVST